MTDNTELKRLAEAATQGDWTHWKHGVIKGGPSVQFTNGSSQQQIVMTTGAEWMRPGEQYANADFIAAANPAAVRALIAENERLSADCSSMRGSLKANAVSIKKLIKDGGRAARERDQLRAEVAGLRTGYEAYERVNAELKAEVGALRKDAERYRWLKSRPVNAPTSGPDLAQWDDHQGDALRGLFADEAIDAAMGHGEQS